MGKTESKQKPPLPVDPHPPSPHDGATPPERPLRGGEDRPRARLPRQQADAVPRLRDPPSSREVSGHQTRYYPVRSAAAGPATPRRGGSSLSAEGSAPEAGGSAPEAGGDSRSPHSPARRQMASTARPPGRLHSSAPRPPPRRSCLRAGSRCCPAFPAPGPASPLAELHLSRDDQLQYTMSDHRISPDTRFLKNTPTSLVKFHLKGILVCALPDCSTVKGRLQSCFKTKRPKPEQKATADALSVLQLTPTFTNESSEFEHGSVIKSSGNRPGLKLPIIENVSVKQKLKCNISLKKVEKIVLDPNKVTSGADLEAVKTCELCQQNLIIDVDNFNVNAYCRSRQQSRILTLRKTDKTLLMFEFHQEAFISSTLFLVFYTPAFLLIKAKTSVFMSHSPFCRPTDVFESPNTNC
ncbi:probable E3 ubiquitin-protein ligase MARCHF10 [Chroicocephalus ridibundus]|uniref:probable E3 ubiquitin-protein ligase MARCHF10 n=1 Tax=Chroicocephalus ridibundus TaxID=1192867 RepID=UPI002FDCBAAB